MVEPHHAISTGNMSEHGVNVHAVLTRLLRTGWEVFPECGQLQVRHPEEEC